MRLNLKLDRGILIGTTVKVSCPQYGAILTSYARRLRQQSTASLGIFRGHPVRLHPTPEESVEEIVRGDVRYGKYCERVRLVDAGD